MRTLEIKQVDAFTSTPFSGNPAGVIMDAEGLSDQDMLMIAGELNLAETAFITASVSGSTMFMIRFFTPTEEVDLSGHVMIASCFSLLEEGRVPVKNGVNTVLFETKAGEIPVDIYYSEEDPGDGRELVKVGRAGSDVGYLSKIMMRQSISGIRPSTIPVEKIAAILGIPREDITSTGLPIEIVSTGLDQLLVPVQRKETIMNLNPDLIRLALANKEYGIDTNHIFTLDTYSDQCVSYARHFAPAVGMWEDPATGTASAGLGMYLTRHGIISFGSMVMEQGREIDSLAKILVEVGNIDSGDMAVSVGGLAVTSIKRTIRMGENTIDIS